VCGAEPFSSPSVPATPPARRQHRQIFRRSQLHIRAALSDFGVDGDQVGISFRGPGYTADGFADRATGQYELLENRLGFIAIVNDLHTGRDTAKPGPV